MRNACWAFWLLTFSLLAPQCLYAHTLAPSLLEISPDGESNEQYHVLWRVDMLTPQMGPAWPSECQTSATQIAQHGRQLDIRYTLHCPISALNQDVTIEGLASAPSAVLLRRMDSDPPNEYLIYPRDPTFTWNETGHSSSPITWRYLQLGFEHILAGLDHLLLMLGLFFLAQGMRALLSLSVCFTLGHSITLLFASMQWIILPSAIVEIAIALTLLYTALQLCKIQDHRHNIRFQYLLFAGFGLIHGLGFASALNPLELNTADLLLAVLGFNLGIESGQILFLAILAAAHSSLNALWHSSQRLSQVFSSYLIGGMAWFWCLDRGLMLLK
ncbi:MAG: HupE/UreJ family protein [Oceanococcus sp.]